MEARPLLEAAYRDAGAGRVVAAVAPTSYGKTVASPWIWKMARKEGLASGLVHVAPLRSLVWRTYQGLFKPHGGRLQMHGAPGDARSPYFLSSLVVTTLDSFLWNLYRVPVAESMKIQRGSSMGHYYPALLGIYASLVVFDEGHMYLWEDPAGDPNTAGASAALAAVAGLAWAGAPVVVETATASPTMVSELVSVAGSVGAEVRVKVLKSPASVERCPYLDSLRDAAGRVDEIMDPDWDSSHLVPWRTYLKPDWDSVLEDIEEDASRGPVLVVANTVDEAVSLYDKLKGRGRVGRLVLVHGRLSNDDRLRAEEGIRDVEDKGGVVVATQVAEAGVDVNALAVYTAAAPLENLVQRAGRACRRGGILDACRGEGGKVVIVEGASMGPYSDKAVVQALDKVRGLVGGDPSKLDWRAPCDHDGRTSYGTLLASVPGGAGVGGVARSLYSSYLRSDARPWTLLEIMDTVGVCGLARDSIMIEVLVETGGKRSAVPVSLEWALSRAARYLEVDQATGVPVLVVEWHSGRQKSMAEGPAARLWKTWKRQLKCRDLVEALVRDVDYILRNSKVGSAAYSARLKARSGVYHPELGLI